MPRSRPVEKQADEIDRSPGPFLKSIISRIIDNGPDGFISNADTFCESDNKFIELTKKSVINYLVRRVITSAIHIWKVNGNPSIDDHVFIRNLRRDISRQFQLKEKDLELTLLCLHKIIENYKQNSIPDGIRNKMKRNAKEGKDKCYLSGYNLEFKEGLDHSYSLDHIWPQMLGGASAEYNLMVASRTFNSTRSY